MLPEAVGKVWWVGVRTGLNQGPTIRSRIAAGGQRPKVLSEAGAQTRLASTSSNNKTEQFQGTQARSVRMQTSFGSCPPRRTGTPGPTEACRYSRAPVRRGPRRGSGASLLRSARWGCAHSWSNCPGAGGEKSLLPHETDKNVFERTLRRAQVLETDAGAFQLFEQGRDAGSLSLRVVAVDELAAVIRKCDVITGDRCGNYIERRAPLRRTAWPATMLFKHSTQRTRLSCSVTHSRQK